MFQKRALSGFSNAGLAWPSTIRNAGSSMSTNLRPILVSAALVAAMSTLIYSKQIDKSPTAMQEVVADDEVTNGKNIAAPTLTKQQTKQQKSVTNWLAKRYRVANHAAHTFVSAAYLTAKDFKLDPLLILSVMAIESGLNPFAESAAGAQGLMQVMSKIHQDKFEEFGGVQAALDPVANIRVGTQILKEYVKRGGSVEAGLKMYVGAALAEDDGGYGNKVLAEYKRLKDVSNGKNVPTVTKAVAPAVKEKPREVVSQEIKMPKTDEHHLDSGLVAAI